MSKINLIECTLRDGGYYNNWNFTKKFANNYLNVLSQLGIDYIEIGFKKIINSRFWTIDAGLRALCSHAHPPGQLQVPKTMNL